MPAAIVGRDEELRLLGTPTLREHLERGIEIERSVEGVDPASSPTLALSELVAEGRSNKEVAVALLLSVKTVEVSLTRVYRKLGVRSRAELARRFLELVARSEADGPGRVLLYGAGRSTRLPTGFDASGLEDAPSADRRARR